MLLLSRSRYYQLVETGFLPKPLTDERSKRPYYNTELQQKCIEARQTGIGVDGSYLLFYAPRKSENASKSRKKRPDSLTQELTETLESMGLNVSPKQVQEVLNELYPDGISGQDQGLVIRELYRNLKQKT